MRSTERTRFHQGVSIGQKSGNAVNFRHLQTLFLCHLWEYCGNPLCNHGFSTPGFTDHQHVMTSCGCEFHRPDQLILSPDIGKIQLFFFLIFNLKHLHPGIMGIRRLSFQIPDHLIQAVKSPDVYALDKFCLVQVLHRNNQCSDAALLCGNNHRKYSPAGPQPAIQ